MPFQHGRLQLLALLQFAAAASALQVTRQGAAAAIPTADEIEAFLRNA